MNICKFILVTILAFGTFFKLTAQKQTDYKNYHRDIIHAEELITDEKYSDALQIFEEVFDKYNYIFSKDYKVAAQLALFTKDEAKAFKFIKLGILDGWTLDEITGDKFFKRLQNEKEWETIKSQYDTLRSEYNKRINQQLGAEIHEMFKRDQRLDLPYYFRIGQKAKERYALRKFAPNSEKQITRLNEILNNYGYPGEKLIGNEIWTLTILIHHNSISRGYVQRDTLYPALKPKLFDAIRKGEMSPGDYALIEDWYVGVKSNWKDAAFGYVTALAKKDSSRSDTLRQSIGLCPIEIRNRLVDIQEQTGMNFYLDGTMWVKGKINFVDKK
ncbi:MAG TPA: hypothetical protein VGI82_09995 [Chitinophagaceae bacterium]